MSFYWKLYQCLLDVLYSIEVSVPMIENFIINLSEIIKLNKLDFEILSASIRFSGNSESWSSEIYERISVLWNGKYLILYNF
jgi:hypothetical protein